MSKSKFKKGLVSEVKIDLQKEKKQEALKEKYQISSKEGKIVVVEKSYLFFQGIRIGIHLLLYIFSFIGLLALVYPETREGLALIIRQILEQLQFCF